VLGAPGLKVGEIGGVSPKGRGFRQRHGFACRRRLGAVQPCDLPLAGPALNA
jgi:hypothetical protein